MSGGRWVLGVDGGGSKTDLAVANREGAVLGPFRAGGTSPFDQPRWLETLLGLLGRCPVPLESLEHASFGLPGYGEVEAVSRAQREAVAGWAGGVPATVMNDVEAAFKGAIPEGAGVLVLAGTGSMAWGETGRELAVRVGGWGEGFGDEGGAYWIGRLALGRLSWALDGRIEDPEFAEALLEAVGAHDAEGLLGWFYGLPHPRSGVAGLAAAVDRLAERGHEGARSILLEAAGMLVAHGLAAWRRLGLDGAGRFSYAGSVFKSATVREGVRAGLAGAGPCLEPRLPPLGGVLLDAARRAGWQPDGGWLERVGTALERG